MTAALPRRSYETAAAGPLAGVRVLDLSRLVAGNMLTQVLGDFGAEVIKVEPREGDLIRSVGRQHLGKSLYATSILRNKRLLGLDLRTPEGQAVARRIALKCDFVVENFRPGTLEQWGLGYHALRDINPQLIMVRISGYGQDGPYSRRPGYGIICEAMGGLRHVNGDPDRPPARMAVSLTDYITGLYAFSGALLALEHRHRTGRGQLVDAALYEASFSLMEQHIGAYDQLGVIANRLGSATGSAPNNLYLTADKRHIHIAANGAAVFRRLAALMNRSDLIEDERFNTAQARSAHHGEMDAIVAQWVGERTLGDVERLLAQAEVPAMRIYDLADIFQDPHYAARHAIAHVADATLGSVAMASPVPRLSESPGAITHSGGEIGQDTTAVLREVAELSDDEIDRLLADGVICQPAPPSASESGV
jgi:crotonobetainyl-CoA:carnitine CoA-transferase CaiB-like acyl-CoA transferase